jgi:flagellin
MSGIVLSASVRQNLLSLQSTAALLATTQNDLATGNKVNSALDNPTEFFTAQGLNNRASDISNLLDGINNGVQVLQAANTGITSLQSLIASAQSIANQVLQAPTGYSTKSTVASAAITGATANNLLGTTAADATFTGVAANNNADLVGTQVGGVLTASQVAAANQQATLGAPLTNDNTTTPAGISLGTQLVGAAGAASNDLVAGAIANNSTITVNGKSITFSTGQTNETTDAATGNITIGIASGSTLTVGTVLSAIDTLSGNTTNPSMVNGTGQVQLNTGTASDLTLGGTALTAFGLTAGTTNLAAGPTSAPDISGTTLLAGPATPGGPSALTGASALTATDTLTVNGKTIAFNTTATTGSATAGTLSIDVNTGTISDVLNAINAITGGTSSVDATTGKITVETNSKTAITLGGTALGKLGLSAGAISIPTATPISLTTALSGASAPGSTALATGFADGDTLTVDGKTITFSSTNPTNTTANGGTISTSGTVQDVLNAIDKITGSTGADVASISAGQITLHTGTGSALSITSSNTGALAALGFGTGVSQADSALTNQTLTIAAVGNGTATNITFGTGAGQVSNLNQLNAALATNNLQASIDSTGVITISTTNNAASSTIGALGGTAVTTLGSAFAADVAGGPPPVADPNSQATRASLVAQYNEVLAQINTTSQDSSFNGINLLNGDTLNLTFDETGASKLSIQGLTFNDAGLGLSDLTQGTDFLDSNSANAVLATLTQASTTLRTAASSLGSNLSTVEIRQDFNKNLIDVLQTGATNLTLADPNEEAANSQALSTRQSIAVSALALANQSQQSVLQLLR